MPDTPGTVAADPLDDDLLDDDPFDEEPAEPPVPDFAFELGLGEAAALATVTVGALAVAVSGEPPPLATETVAENWIVSPAGAVLGTLTCASICGAAGWFAGRARSRLPLPGWPVPPVNVKTGLNAGVFALGVSVVMIVAPCWDGSQAETRNEMVPPGVTLVADAETVTSGLLGTGEPSPDGAEARQVLEDDGDGEGEGEELCWLSPLGREEAPEEESVVLAAGADNWTVAAPDDAAADVAADDDGADNDGADNDGADNDGDALDDRAGVGVAAGPGDDEVLCPGAGVAEADGAMARTMAVAPLKLTKRPVARTSVAGRARLDRINIPSVDAVRAENKPYGAFGAVASADCARPRISPGRPRFSWWGPRSGACRRARPPARRRWPR